MPLPENATSPLVCSVLLCASHVRTHVSTHAVRVCTPLSARQRTQQTTHGEHQHQSESVPRSHAKLHAVAHRDLRVLGRSSSRGERTERAGELQPRPLQPDAQFATQSRISSRLGGVRLSSERYLSVVQAMSAVVCSVQLALICTSSGAATVETPPVHCAVVSHTTVPVVAGFSTDTAAAATTQSRHPSTRSLQEQRWS